MTGLNHLIRRSSRPGRTRSQGSAYFLVMMCLVALAALAVTVLGETYSRSLSSEISLRSARAYCIAESGIWTALAELTGGVDPDDDDLGTVSNVLDGGSFRVTAVENAPGDYTLTSVGTYSSLRRAIEVVTQRRRSLFEYRGRAAITCKGPVLFNGNMAVDGRDRTTNGVLTGDPGVLGVSGKGSVTRQGSAGIGGNGVQPNTTSNVFEALHSWADGLDNDGDGTTDEEPYDGIDNDGDDSVDEDVNSYPNGPDAALKLPPGTLKSVAMLQGMYFSAEVDFIAFLAGNGGEVPGGVVIYLEMNEWGIADFGGAMNSTPSILVIHNNSSTALIRNVKGRFKGLVLADQVDKVNNLAEILGAVMTFSTATSGSIFGNGSGSVLYSSEVLTSLPTNELVRDFVLRSWREVSAR